MLSRHGFRQKYAVIGLEECDAGGVSARRCDPQDGGLRVAPSAGERSQRRVVGHVDVLAIHGAQPLAADHRATVAADAITAAERITKAGTTNASIPGWCTSAIYLAIPRAKRIPKITPALTSIPAIVNPCNPAYRPAELAYILADSEPMLVLTDRERLPLMKRLRDDVPSVRHIVTMEELPEDEAVPPHEAVHGYGHRHSTIGR